MLAHQLKRAGSSAGGASAVLDASDVFSTYLYTGNGSTQTINNGIDLVGQGGMVWIKDRNSGAMGHHIGDTIRGVTKDLQTQSINAQVTANNFTAFSSNSFTLSSNSDVNNASTLYASWTFREASKFFHQELKVHTNGTASTVDLTTLGTVGMVTVKSTVNAGNWFTWHKDLTAGNNLKLNLTDAQSTTNAYLSVSGTTLTIDSTAPSDTYIVYSWAHDTSADGIIQCGSYTEGAGDVSATLGWEPQYLLVKSYSVAGTSWYQTDIMRGFNNTGGSILYPNTSGAEYNGSAYFIPTATGFTVKPLQGSGVQYVYMAIRRPNKVPTSGTEVYNAIARTGTGAVATVTGVGFAPDLALISARVNAGAISPACLGVATDRLRGINEFAVTSNTFTQASGYGSASGTASFDMNGISLTSTDFAGGATNFNSWTYINHFFKRAKEFFDEVCDTGTGSVHTVPHNLGKAPELWLRKGRSGATQWVWGSSLLANTEKVNMPTTIGKATDANAWNSTYPTASVFTVGTSADVNTNTATYVTYLWGSVVGVSKIGTFTGNGTSQTINCGFSTGARFVLIFRTDASGEFYIWDTVRGIVAGNDPHLSLNTTTAEITTDDTIDPDASGFIVNQVAATNVNVTSATYIYLAIS